MGRGLAASRNEPASPNSVVAEHDVLLVVGPSKERSRRQARASGRRRPDVWSKDRPDLDYLRVFASRPTVVGRALGGLDLPGEKASVLMIFPGMTIVKIPFVDIVPALL